MPLPPLRWLMLGALAATQAAAGAETAPALRDPWVPPPVRAQAQAEGRSEPTRGAALAAQVERKLRRRFEAADAAGSGRITREQARAAGLGRIADDFERIDAAGSGSVSFDEVKRYLRARGARTL